MNDPHVDAVVYTIDFADEVEFIEPEEPFVSRLGAFAMTVRDKEIKLVPDAHFASREEVRIVTDMLVEAWRIESSLRMGLTQLRIRHIRTIISDRKPTAGVIHLQGEGVVVFTGKATATLTRRIATYPAAPTPGFSVDPDVDTLARRYAGYLRGQEPLLAMGYFVYTMLTPGKTTKKEAAAQLNVDWKVLDTLSNLTSTRGDRLSSRKALDSPAPLTPEEGNWLTTAIPEIIIRYGCRAEAAALPKITLGNLPAL